MVDITQIMRFDDLASKNSPIHNLEGRIKLISTIFIILVCVISKELFIPIILEIILLVILKLAKLSYWDSAKRLLMLLPFGGAIIIFQPFIQPGNIIWSYSWLTITDVGLQLGDIAFGPYDCILNSNHSSIHQLHHFKRWQVHLEN